MAAARLDDATLKLLQDYAAIAAERLGLQVTVSVDDRSYIAINILRESGGERRSFNHAHPYSTHDDAVQFISRMLGQASKAP